MREKFLVWNVGEVLGVRYDEDKREVLIGGPASAYMFREKVAECFDSEGEWVVNVSRARLVLDGVSRAEWRQGVRRMRQAGYTLEQVKSFRRLLS